MNSQDEKSTQELQELHAHISQRMIAVTSEKQRHQQLTEALAEAQRIYKSREAEYSAIEHTFFEHTRTVRATDDDLSTIREAFKILKYAITRLIMSLNKKADLDRARAKFSARWPHITFEPALVNLLAEKMVHEHLIHSVFAHIYPGLKINAACRTLSHWLQENQSTLCLRQQVAAIIAKSPKDGEIQKEAEIEKEKIKTAIYQDLADVYHPYLNEDKGCHQKLSDIVDRAVKLVVAIRGQDVDISTVSIEEGKQVLDEETMVEAKGRTSGVVQFCICPTFMGGDKEHGFLEKAKVVVS
ncbi:hypothetical protein G6F56_005689 [Rhizopus delemar]|uniref:Uncharacterized protein n=1 Tax=Rhizopus stolonifer TaxID=4846 RepID=A0A367KQU6_RHIST|nr:hypothetical protein G6F56_005689 [Rhizopus delemar]RCI04585.1 hypothetical protein CU098_012388 [Rhizopus stolonifer]